MNENQCLIKAHHLSSDSASPSRWLTWGQLPAALQQQAVRRLGLLAVFVTGGTITLFVVFALVMRTERARLYGFYGGSVFMYLPALVGLCQILVSIGVAVASRLRRLAPSTMLRIGLAYQLLTAINFGLLQHFHTWQGFWIYTGWSHVAVWIIVFAVMVPASPGRTLMTATLVALCDPLTLLLTVAMGAPLPSPSMLAMLFLPTGLGVVAACASSIIVHRLGRDIERAEELGSYKLVERLGHGGMGDVWRAEHHALARPAAIKLIRPAALASSAEDSATVVRRFEREAQATAQLKSDHTIGVYDFGQRDDGSFFYVMELLEGVDLERCVARFGPMPAGRVVSLLRQCCHSLAEAHSVGLVHRDIKPANIYLCRHGLDVDYVKVLDFGLVKQSLGGTDDSASQAKLTLKGQISGTPAYMAPEVAMGEGELDGRVDIYALGCVAYWLLTGKTVFEASNPLKMLLQHAHETPKPPSERGDCELPKALEELVLCCLAKEPLARPPSALALDAQLAQLADDGCPWTDSEARAWWSEHLPVGASNAGETPVPQISEPSVAPTLPMESEPPSA